MSSKKSVQRYDVGGLESPKRTAAGFLRADAYLTRAGIFTYRNPDGTTRKELRPEDEVFRADSMSSFALAPVTDDHPPANLTPKTAREFARGSITDSVRQDGEFMRASMLITDDELIDKLERKEKQDVSCGYTCDLDETPGAWKGQRYDAVQRNIVGNHVAVVPRGRAGAGARVRMDAADAGMVSDDSPVAEATTTEEHKPMSGKTFRHDGVTYEGSDQVVELFAKLERNRMDAIKDRDDALAEAKKEISKAQARADDAEEKLKVAKADGEKLPAQIRKEIGARMALEATARKHLGKAHKLDGLTDREVKVAVLKKLQPKLDVSAKDDSYISARLDMVEENTQVDTTDEIARARKDTGTEHADEGEEGEERLDAAAAHERMRAANRDQWKQPIGRIVAK